MILTISRFRVKNNLQDAVAEAFAHRPGLVDLQPGFLGIEVYTDAQDDATFNLVTRWSDEASFRAWHHSDAHKESHRGIPKGIKLDPGKTQLFVMNAIPSAARAQGLESEVANAAPFVAEFLLRSRSLFFVAASTQGQVQACNPAAASLLNIDAANIAANNARNVLFTRFTDASAKELQRRIESGQRRPDERFVLQPRDAPGGMQSLDCQMDLRPDGFVLIGESAESDDTRLFEGLTGINNELAGVMREAARKEQALARALAELEQKNQQLEQANQRITELARTDTLTGVFNRRHFDELFATEVMRARRLGTSLTAMMVDLDHFKSINDQYGHGVGDAVLAAVGPALQSSSRAHDVVARYGGEEFVLLLPETSLEEGLHYAERLRQLIADLTVNECDQPITASFGVARLTEGEESAELLQRADAALYRAKDAGRNRVEADTL